MKKAFTLIEIILVFAIISLLLSSGGYLTFHYFLNNELEEALETLKSALREASFKARAVEGDSEWGVKLQPGSITVFRGNSFVGRNPSFDEVYQFANSLSLVGPSEIIFSKLTAEPSVVDSIIIKTAGNVSKKIDIQKEGVIY